MRDKEMRRPGEEEGVTIRPSHICSCLGQWKHPQQIETRRNIIQAFAASLGEKVRTFRTVFLQVSNIHPPN